MSDIDKFHEWVETQSPLALREYMFAQAAWQARGALDAVRIKELELANKILIGMTDNMANQISEYEVIDKGQLERIKELEAKFEHEQKDCTKKCDIYIATKKQMDYEKNLASAQTEIAELTAKLDKARDGDCCTEGCIKCDARKVLAETQEAVYTNGDRTMSMKDRNFTSEGNGYIQDNNFDFDAGLRIDGDFVNDERDQYAQMICNALNTTPPSREWVGLSDDELELILLIRGLTYKTLAEKIEAKLREKNG